MSLHDVHPLTRDPVMQAPADAPSGNPRRTSERETNIFR